MIMMTIIKDDDSNDQDDDGDGDGDTDDVHSETRILMRMMTKTMIVMMILCCS